MSSTHHDLDFNVCQYFFTTLLRLHSQKNRYPAEDALCKMPNPTQHKHARGVPSHESVTRVQAKVACYALARDVF